jgi:hypothetical protein
MTHTQSFNAGKESLNHAGTDDESLRLTKYGESRQRVKRFVVLLSPVPMVAVDMRLNPHRRSSPRYSTGADQSCSFGIEWTNRVILFNQKQQTGDADKLRLLSEMKSC